MPDKNLRQDLIRLAHQEPSLRPHLLPLLHKEAASEIPLSELPKEQTKLAQDVAKKTTAKPIQAWSGINGYIVMYEPKMGRSRFGKELLKILMKSSVFRWIEANKQGGISIGM